MSERALEKIWRVIAASFADDAVAAALRARMGRGFPEAIALVITALAEDLAAAPKDLDRERVGELMRLYLPGRLSGSEPWAREIPNLLDELLAFVAFRESLPDGWSFAATVDAARADFAAALADPARPRFGTARRDAPHRRPSEKLGRNDPCFCGSGKKYKSCCLRLL